MIYPTIGRPAMILAGIVLATSQAWGAQGQPPKIPSFLAAAVADPARPAADVERDANRKPAETLEFAGLQPGFPDPVTGDTTPKKQVALLLELDQKDRNGKPLLVNKYMTSSFSSLATLTKVLRAILGRGLTAAEIDNGIDGDMVHGKPCAVMIVLKETAKGNWASVETVLPHVKSMPVLTPYMKVNDPLPIWLQRKIDQQIVIEPEVPSAEDEQVLA